jgi:hypothetical protein
MPSGRDPGDGEHAAHVGGCGCREHHGIESGPARHMFAQRSGLLLAVSASASGLPMDDWLDGLAGTTALGRLPVRDEVAEYLAFAASDRAASMTDVIANLSAGALVD